MQLIRRLDVTLAFAVLWAGPAAAAERPISAFFDEFARDWVRAEPQRATALQYCEGAEQDPLDRKLPPITREFRLARIAAARRGLEALHRYDRKSLSADEAISYAAMEWQGG